jgi:hypothetical protein
MCPDIHVTDAAGGKLAPPQQTIVVPLAEYLLQSHVISQTRVRQKVKPVFPDVMPERGVPAKYPLKQHGKTVGKFKIAP